MIVESKFTHVYRLPKCGATILPGLNLIPDGIGRLLEAHPHFQETVAGCPDKLIVRQKAAPATPEEKKAEADAAAQMEKLGPARATMLPIIPAGVVATKSLKADAALKFISEAMDVDQLRDVANRDTRPEVKHAAADRIKSLAHDAESTASNADVEAAAIA